MPNENTIRKTIKIEGPFSSELIRPLIETGSLTNRFICDFLYRKYMEEMLDGMEILFEIEHPTGDDFKPKPKPKPGQLGDLEMPPLEEEREIVKGTRPKITISDKAKQLLQKAKKLGCSWAFREEQILNNYSNDE